MSGERELDEGANGNGASWRQLAATALTTGAVIIGGQAGFDHVRERVWTEPGVQAATWTEAGHQEVSAAVAAAVDAVREHAELRQYARDLTDALRIELVTRIERETDARRMVNEALRQLILECQARIDAQPPADLVSAVVQLEGREAHRDPAYIPIMRDWIRRGGAKVLNR